MKNKKNKELIFLGLSLSLVSFSVYPFGTINPAKDQAEKNLTNSPYPSCKDVKMVSADDYEENTNYWDKRCHNGEKILILSKTGKLVTNLENATASLALLQEVGNKFKEVFDQKIAEKEKILKCFQSEDASNKKCEAIRKKEIQNTYANFINLRQELALSEGKSPVFEGGNRGYAGHLVFPETSDAVNSSLKKSYLGLAGVIRAEDTYELSDSEKKVAEEKMQNEIEQIKKQKIDDKQKLSLFRQVRSTHKAHYLKLLGDSPLLSVLGKLPPWNKNQDKPDNLTEVNKAFVKGYSELLKAAKKERVKMAVAWNHAVYEPKKVGVRGYRATGDNDRAKELLNLMAYVPIVDEVISEQKKKTPQVCALATSLLQNMEDSDFRSNAMVGGATMVGAVAVTALTSGLDSLVLPEMIPVIGGLGMTSQSATALALGIGMGVTSRHQSKEDLDTAKGSMSIGIKTAEDVDKADSSVATGLTLMPLDLVGAGIFKGAGAAVYKTFAKNALQAEGLALKDADELIRIAANSAHSEASKETSKEAQKKINDIMTKRLAKIFGKSKPSNEEVALVNELDKSNMDLNDFFDNIKNLQRDEKKTVIKDAIAILKETSPEVFNTNDPLKLKAINKQIISIIRYGKVEDPKKIAAILKGWDHEAKEGLKNTYDQALDFLKDKSFKPNLSLKKRREEAFKKALISKGIKTEDANTMCTCASVCKGGARSPRSIDITMNINKLKMVHVCVQDEKSVWYTPNNKKKYN